MAHRNSSIRNYFKPSLYPSQAPINADYKKRGPRPIDPIFTETSHGDAKEGSLLRTLPVEEASREVDSEDSDHLEAIPVAESPIVQYSRDCVINCSDEEDSDSESSVEDIYVALQQQGQPRYSHSAKDGSKSPEKCRSRSKRTRMLVQPSPAKPKYKFDMKTLVEQAERHKATEASALSMNSALDAVNDKSQDKGEEIARDSILQSVIAEKEKDGVDAGKFLLAVRRTKATHSEKGWYFFHSVRDHSSTPRRFPAYTEATGWKALLASSQSKPQVLLSGFARDMVALEGTLDHDLFGWMLGEICFENRNDLREAYCKILEGMPDQIGLFMSHEVMKRLFENLGAKKAAYDINEEIKLISKDRSHYEGQNWTTVSAVVSFVGRNSAHLTIEASSYTLCVLARLCIDSIVIQDIGLLAAVQKTLEQLCERIEGSNWGKIVSTSTRGHFVQG